MTIIPLLRLLLFKWRLWARLWARLFEGGLRCRATLGVVPVAAAAIPGTDPSSSAVARHRGEVRVEQLAHVRPSVRVLEVVVLRVAPGGAVVRIRRVHDVSLGLGELPAHEVVEGALLAV